MSKIYSDLVRRSCLWPSLIKSLPKHFEAGQYSNIFKIQNIFYTTSFRPLKKNHLACLAFKRLAEWLFLIRNVNLTTTIYFILANFWGDFFKQSIKKEKAVISNSFLQNRQRLRQCQTWIPFITYYLRLLMSRC